MSVKRVYRIWRREGLKVPSKQPKRGRLWLNDGSCIRLPADRPNHVWSYDFSRTAPRMGGASQLTVIDEFTRRCLAIVVARKLRSDDGSTPHGSVVADGSPEHIAPTMVPSRARNGAAGLVGSASRHSIEPGSPGRIAT